MLGSVIFRFWGVSEFWIFFLGGGFGDFAVLGFLGLGFRDFGVLGLRGFRVWGF